MPRRDQPAADDRCLTRDEALRILRAHQAELRERFGVTELALFGSTVRNEARPDSDVDILADFVGECDWTMLDAAKQFLEQILNHSVDLVSRPRLYEKVRPWVEREELPVFNPPTHWSLPVPLDKRWDMYVDDMLEFCSLSLEFTESFDLDALVEDRRSYMATLQALQTIGEAANKIPREIHDQHPEIPWVDIINARNWIAHGYDAVEPSEIWKMVTVSVPQLLPQLRALKVEAVAELPEDLRDA